MRIKCRHQEEFGVMCFSCRDKQRSQNTAVAVKAGGTGVLFIPDTLTFPDGDFNALEMIAKETGMTVVCGPAEAIEQVEVRPA